MLFFDKIFSGHQSENGSIGLGMILHGITDGMALAVTNWNNSHGDENSTKASSMNSIIFIGIFLHKLPAAFGLSVCLAENKFINRCDSVVALVLFSLAAPAGAVITLLILQLTDGGAEVSSRSILPGVLLLLSSGSFLYISLCHILPECLKKQLSSENDNLRKRHDSDKIRQDILDELVEEELEQLQYADETKTGFERQYHTFNYEVHASSGVDNLTIHYMLLSCGLLAPLFLLYVF